MGLLIDFAATGEMDAMFEALDVAHGQRDRMLLEIQNESLWDPYRADPRLQALLQRMNLAKNVAHEFLGCTR